MAKFKWERPSQADLNTETKKQSERTSLYDSIILPKFKQFRPKKGENKVRLLPPTFGNKKYFPYLIFVHYNCGPDNGTYLCEDRMFGEDCACCDEQRNLRESGDAKAAGRIKPTNAYIAWVIDRDDHDAGPQVYRYGYTMGASIAAVSIDEEHGGALCVFDPEEGYDLAFTKEEKGGDARNVDYIGHRFARRASPIHRDEKVQDEWLEYITDNPLPDTLQRYPYEHVAKCFGGRRTVREDEPDEDQLPPRTSRSVRDEDDDDRPPPRRTRPDYGDDGNAPPRREPEQDRPSQREPEPEDDDPPPRRTRSTAEIIDDEIPERAGGNRAGERTNGKAHDDPPFEGGERRRTREPEPEEEQPRRRPRLQEDEEPHERATRAVDRLRERARR